MNVSLFSHTSEFHTEIKNQVRVEVPLDIQGTHIAILLDAEDSFDVIIEYPNGERETVWTIDK